MLNVLKDSVRYYFRQDARILSAAVAFYALLSIAPLGLITLFFVKLLIGQEQATHLFKDSVSLSLGGDVGSEITRHVDSGGEIRGGIVAVTLTLFITLLSSNRLLGTLRASVRTFWKQGRHKLSAPGLLRSILLIPMTGLVVALLLVARFLLDALTPSLPKEFTPIWVFVTKEGSVLFSFFVAILLVFHLEGRQLSWKIKSIGAVITSLLVALVATVTGIYLRNANLASYLGGGGAALVLLLWAYYTAQAFFFGASLTYCAFIKNEDEEVASGGGKELVKEGFTKITDSLLE